MDDRMTNYSIGQQFVTRDNHRCFCGNGGSISCDQIDSESSKLRLLTYSQGVAIGSQSFTTAMLT